jgi:hypothetical protein
MLSCQSLLVLCQEDKESHVFYLKNYPEGDSSYYFSIVKGKNGFKFVFKENIFTYYILKDSVNLLFDTITERNTPEYGPYVLKLRGNKIIYKAIGRDKKFHDLYDLSGKEHLSPDLFSTSNSYSILNQLSDSMVILNLNNQQINCYKFLQKRTGHNPLDFRYSILYINKKTLLPCKFEYYVSCDLTQKKEEIYQIDN